MKRKIFVGVLTVALTLSSAVCFGGNANEVFARGYCTDGGESITELVTDDSRFDVADLIDGSDFYELSVGDDVEASVSVVDKDGNAVSGIEFCTPEEVKEFDLGFASEERFYSEFDDLDKANMDENKVVFDGVVPKEAFGKYVYRWIVVTFSDSVGVKLIRSRYRITSFCGSDYITFSLNDDKKSVTAFTILNQNFAFTASIPKTVKENGKSYTVTDIGSYALENADGKGMKALVLPNSIKTIGEKAFEGAKNLKTISIKSNLSSVGKNAFKGINKKAVFKIKASAKNYKKIVFKIKQSGVAKTVKFKRRVCEFISVN